MSNLKWKTGIVKSTLTEWTGWEHHGQTQMQGFKEPCAEMQLDLLECMEAYGLYKGRRECRDLISDMDQCSHAYYSRYRRQEMTKERVKQVVRGERDPLNFWENQIPRDAYQWGPFY